MALTWIKKSDRYCWNNFSQSYITLIYYTVHILDFKATLRSLAIARSPAPSFLGRCGISTLFPAYSISFEQPQLTPKSPKVLYFCNPSYHDLQRSHSIAKTTSQHTIITA